MSYQFNRKIGVAALSLCALLIAATMAFVYRPVTKNLLSVNATLASQTPQPPVVNQARRVKRVRLWPQFQNSLQALGDRLEATGKERLILMGTIKRNSAKAGEVVTRLIVEMPDKLRLEEQIGNTIQITTFDGEKQDGLKRSDAAISDERDEDEIESLIFDGVEHLFSGQMAGLAKREIGVYLQPNQPAVANYTGPYYNVYEVMDRITLLAPAQRMQRKLYYFNAETSLPEIIRYQVKRSRGLLNVEIRLTDWQKLNGQFIPGTFIRLENDVEVLQLKVNAAGVQPTANDGIFTIPGK
ncbi:MAG: hypothetical protein AAB401_19280 [Acidobacteriota bacterium]